MSDQLYFLDTKYGCGGVIVKDNKVYKTCPLYKWMIGKPFGEVLNNLVRANALRKYEAVGDIEEEEENGGLLPSIPENNGA
jgi:hypothetical protein